jgi:hypothetical protein
MSDLGYRKNHVTIAALAVVLAGLPLVITSEVPAYVSASTSSPIASNMLAANGPLPRNLSLYAEVACSAAQNTSGYYSSLNGAEVADAQRSELYPCANFTGSFTNASENVVYAWRSQDEYPAISYLNNREPGELYIVGGDNPNLTGLVTPGPYVAKADATTGAQLWRTYLDNANTNNDWIATNNLNILPDGNILFAFARQVVLLDGNT